MKTILQFAILAPLCFGCDSSNGQEITRSGRKELATAPLANENTGAHQYQYVGIIEKVTSTESGETATNFQLMVQQQYEGRGVYNYLPMAFSFEETRKLLKLVESLETEPLSGDDELRGEIKQSIGNGNGRVKLAKFSSQKVASEQVQHEEGSSFTNLSNAENRWGDLEYEKQVWLLIWQVNPVGDYHAKWLPVDSAALKNILREAIKET